MSIMTDCMLLQDIRKRNKPLNEMTLKELEGIAAYLEWAIFKTGQMNKPTDELKMAAAKVEAAIRKLGENNETTDR